MDVIARHLLLSFMDTFSRYNQIPMLTLDSEKKTAFITP